jgi:hypothetical protein
MTQTFSWLCLTNDGGQSFGCLFVSVDIYLEKNGFYTRSCRK